MAATETAGRWRRGRLGREARASLAAFLLGASVAALPLALGSPSALLAAPGLRGRLALALHVAVVNAALLLLYPRPLYKVRGGAGRCGAVRCGRGGAGLGHGADSSALPALCLQIAIRAGFLGFAFGCGLLLSAGRSAWRHFGW